MANDESPEGHYWSYYNSSRSVPTSYRQCTLCGRLDASQAIAEAVEAARLTARDFVIAAPTSQDPRNQRLYESPDNPIGGFPAVMDGPIRENGNQPPTVISTYALRDAILWWLETKFDERFDTRLDRLSNPQPLKEKQ